MARKAGATLQNRGNSMRIGDNPDARNRTNSLMQNHLNL